MHNAYSQIDAAGRDHSQFIAAAIVRWRASSASSKITTSLKTLYMRKPVALETAMRPNLDKALMDLIVSGKELVVTNQVFPDTSLGLVVTLI
jgi:hypothetical protein